MSHGTVHGAPIDTDVNLGGGSPSDQLIPSQKAAKAYVDASVVTAHTALTSLGWTASGHTTAAALDVPYWSGTTTPAVVTAPASGSRVGRVLGWTADGTIGWVHAVAVGLLGAEVVSSNLLDVPNCTTVDVL
jgi:hypothetical protein